MDLVLITRERNGVTETVAVERRFLEAALAKKPMPQEVPEEEPEEESHRSWWRP